jgi:hypothetical protein
MKRMLGWDDLRQLGEKRSKSQIHRDIRHGKFPAPAGHNGRSPFWTEEQIGPHIERLITNPDAKVERV